MNYLRLHKINKYLTNRNRTDIDNNKYVNLYNYINTMKPYIGKLRTNKFYIKYHYLYSDNSDRMLIHINTNDNKISISNTVIEYIHSVLGNDTDIRSVIDDIIDIHFKDYKNIFKSKMKYRLGFFAENRTTPIEETYAEYKFKRLSNKEYEKRRGKNHNH